MSAETITNTFRATATGSAMILNQPNPSLHCESLNPPAAKLAKPRVVLALPHLAFDAPEIGKLHVGAGSHKKSRTEFIRKLFNNR